MINFTPLSIKKTSDKEFDFLSECQITGETQPWQKNLSLKECQKNKALKKKRWKKLLPHLLLPMFSPLSIKSGCEGQMGF